MFNRPNTYNNQKNKDKQLYGHYNSYDDENKLEKTNKLQNLDLMLKKQILNELQSESRSFPQLENIKKEFRKMLYYFLNKKFNLTKLGDMNPETRQQLIKNCTILLYNHYKEASEYKKYVSEISKSYLNTIGVYIHPDDISSLNTETLHSVIQSNNINKDFLSKFSEKPLNDKIRLFIYTTALKNDKIENEYLNKRQKHILETVSIYDARIWRDLLALCDKIRLKFLYQKIALENAKKILSFYEKSKNKLANENLSYVVLLFVYAFNENGYMHSRIFQLIGMFFRLIEAISNIIDKGFEFITQENKPLYLSLHKSILNNLKRVDEEDLFSVIDQALNNDRNSIAEYSKQDLFIELLKRFTRSFGLSLLNSQVALFIMDQFVIFLCKNHKTTDEISRIIAASFLSALICCKEDLLLNHSFESLLATIGNSFRQINLTNFIAKYVSIIGKIHVGEVDFYKELKDYYNGDYNIMDLPENWVLEYENVNEVNVEYRNEESDKNDKLTRNDNYEEIKSKETNKNFVNDN